VEGNLVTTIVEPITGSMEKTSSRFLVVLVGYFLIQILIRVLQGGSVEMDESEQIFYTQHWRLGYENQPPLYTWVQAAMFALVGVGHLGLALVKNIFMFALYASVYQVARPLLGRLGSTVVSASLIMIITLGWEAQIDRTHSILVTAVAAASLWTYYALLRHPSRWRRALLGALFGLGMLSKYNFLLFVLGLVGASLLVREHRRVVWTRDCWITPAVGLLLVSPHAYWFTQQVHIATAETLRKMHEGGSPSTYGMNLLVGTRFLGQSIASFITPLWLPLAFAWRGRRPGTPRRESADVRFFFWLYASGLGCIAAMVLSGELIHIQSRWLQPLLFSFPLGFFVFFPPKSERVYRRLLLTMGIFAVVLITALGFRPQIQAGLGRHPRIFQPYSELADSIERRFPGVDAFVVQDRFVGGNIRLQFPQLPVVLMKDACAQRGRVMILSGDGFDDGPRSPMPACPGMHVAGRGQLAERNTLRPRERLAFDYLLADMAAGAPAK
jgi:hypothetical protein